MNSRTLFVALAGAMGAAAASYSQVAIAPQPAAPPPEVFPTTPFVDDLTPGYVLIEGDIQVPLAQYIAITSGVGDSTFGTVNYWTLGVVPYDFVTSGGGAVSAANQTNAINAMNAISAFAGVTFRPATGTEDRVRFQNSSFNNSPVGRQGGSQIINIVNWNTQVIIIHELFHSLGFWHEQSRPDRGTYVTINSNNICGSAISNACTAGTGAGQCCLCTNSAGTCISCAFNFNVTSGAGSLGGYDFDSLMHYGRTAFSCNGSDTITVNATWNAQWQNAIGQRDHVSYFDGITCRGLYPFSGDRWLDNSYGGPAFTGAMLTPWNVSFSSAFNSTPVGGTLFIRNSAGYSAIGTYNRAVTIQPTTGPVTLGN